jgi:hypothetical protein
MLLAEHTRVILIRFIDCNSYFKASCNQTLSSFSKLIMIQEIIHDIYFFPPLGLQPSWSLASDFSFMIILQTVGLLDRVISSSQGLYHNTGHHKHGINTYTYQTSIPYVGFEPMIPASERAKTLYALDSSAIVTSI